MSDAAQTTDAAASRAEALLEVGREADAAALLRQALATDPDDTWLLDLLAQATLRVDPAASLDAATRLLTLDPDGHRGHLLAAIACGNLGHGKDGEAHAREAVARAPWLPGPHAVLAQALVDRHRKLREALREAERAVELAPHDTIGFVTAGNVELRRGRTRKAARWYEQALELDPSDRTAQTNIAITNRAKGRLNRAFDDVDSLLRLDPRDESARRALDDTAYTTLVHLQWVVLTVAFAVAAWKVG